MKFFDIWVLLNTDNYWITVDGDIETTVYAEGTAQEIVHKMEKFFGYTVERITPVNN